jgi:hypothetical protein
MSSEYDPVRTTIDDPLAEDDLERVRDHFEAASRPYLSQPWSWLAWSLILPAAALVTPAVLQSTGGLGTLLLWTAAVLVGGLIEAVLILRARRRRAASSTLAAWVLRAQGNLSVVALLLSIAVVWQDLAWLLPGLWLLLLGHSLYSLGGLASPALRVGGLVYQVGGALAVWPHGRGLTLFAAATFLGNLWVAWSIWRARSGSR